MPLNISYDVENYKDDYDNDIDCSNDNDKRKTRYSGKSNERYRHYMLTDNYHDGDY